MLLADCRVNHSVVSALIRREVPELKSRSRQAQLAKRSTDEALSRAAEALRRGGNQG